MGKLHTRDLNVFWYDKGNILNRLMGSLSYILKKFQMPYKILSLLNLIHGMDYSDHQITFAEIS